MTTYPGDSKTYQVEIRDDDNILIDPPVLKCHTKSPRGVRVTYIYGVSTLIEKVSTGIYTLTVNYTYELTTGGVWFIDAQALDSGGTPISRAVQPLQVNVLNPGTL